MYILAVDDEELARAGLMRALKEVFSGADVLGFSKASEACDTLREITAQGAHVSYAFLDIELRGRDGISLAKELLAIEPQLRIVFVTAYDQYAMEAYQIYAKGYLLKPVSVSQLEELLMHIEPDWKKELTEAEPERLKVVTFGDFAVFANDQPLLFERRKSKELFAYLIDRQGAGASNAQLEAVLWEDANGEKRKSKYLQKVIASMVAALEAAGFKDAIIRKRDYIAVDVTKLDCDYYRMQQGDTAAIHAFQGSYMPEYSWAEETTGRLYSNYCTEILH